MHHSKPCEKCNNRVEIFGKIYFNLLSVFLIDIGVTFFPLSGFTWNLIGWCKKSKETCSMIVRCVMYLKLEIWIFQDKNDKSSPKFFLPWTPKKDAQYFLPIFYKRYGYGRHVSCRTKFVWISVHMQVFEQNHCFLASPEPVFPFIRHKVPHKYSMKTSKYAPLNNLSCKLILSTWL